MGVSSDGILAYGVPLVESYTLTDDELYKYPWEAEKYDGDHDQWLKDILGLPVWDDPVYNYEKEKQAIALCPFELVMHCSYDCPMWFAAIRGTFHMAWRGSPVKIPESFVNLPHAEFYEFLDLHEIPYDDQEVGWHLMSLYG